MVALYQQLQKTGVDLAEEVGFIRRERSEAGEWQVTRAVAARVLTKAPVDVDTGEPALEYDPELTLLLAATVSGEEDLTLFILEVDEAVIFYDVPGVGMVFTTEDQHFEVSQHPDFWDDVYGFMAALGQPPHKGDTNV
jgi:hypothetical protein